MSNFNNIIKNIDACLAMEQEEKVFFWKETVYKDLFSNDTLNTNHPDFPLSHLKTTASVAAETYILNTYQSYSRLSFWQKWVWRLSHWDESIADYASLYRIIYLKRMKAFCEEYQEFPSTPNFLDYPKAFLPWLDFVVAYFYALLPRNLNWFERFFQEPYMQLHQELSKELNKSSEALQEILAQGCTLLMHRLDKPERFQQTKALDAIFTMLDNQHAMISEVSEDEAKILKQYKAILWLLSDLKKVADAPDACEIDEVALPQELLFEGEMFYTHFQEDIQRCQLGYATRYIKKNQRPYGLVKAFTYVIELNDTGKVTQISYVNAEGITEEVSLVHNKTNITDFLQTEHLARIVDHPDLAFNSRLEQLKGLLKRDVLAETVEKCSLYLLRYHEDASIKPGQLVLKYRRHFEKQGQGLRDCISQTTIDVERLEQAFTLGAKKIHQQQGKIKEALVIALLKATPSSKNNLMPIFEAVLKDADKDLQGLSSRDCMELYLMFKKTHPFFIEALEKAKMPAYIEDHLYSFFGLYSIPSTFHIYNTFINTPTHYQQALKASYTDSIYATAAAKFLACSQLCADKDVLKNVFKEIQRLTALTLAQAKPLPAPALAPAPAPVSVKKVLVCPEAAKTPVLSLAIIDDAKRWEHWVCHVLLQNDKQIKNRVLEMKDVFNRREQHLWNDFEKSKQRFNALVDVLGYWIFKDRQMSYYSTRAVEKNLAEAKEITALYRRNWSLFNHPDKHQESGETGISDINNLIDQGNKTIDMAATSCLIPEHNFQKYRPGFDGSLTAYSQRDRRKELDDIAREQAEIRRQMEQDRQEMKRQRKEDRQELEKLREDLRELERQREEDLQEQEKQRQKYRRELDERLTNLERQIEEVYGNPKC